MAQPPIACDRAALMAEARRRHFDEIGPALQARAKQVREIVDGFEFTFPPDDNTSRLLADWAAGERRCCPFFNIEIYGDLHPGSQRLRLTGPQGAKELIRTELASWFSY